MISQDRMEKGLVYLSETDELVAYHKAHVARTEYKAKRVKQALFLLSEGTVAERTAIAETADEYKEALANYFEALREYEHVRAKRATELVVIDTWRTVEASRRKGNIT